MPLRERNGNWHYRFQIAGRVYTGDSGLAATERNESAATRIEVSERERIESGKPPLARLEPRLFSDAAESFLAWCDGEKRVTTARRIRASFRSLRDFFSREPVHTLTAGAIEDYKTYRRKETVKEITLRHDLYALSEFFDYAQKHRWIGCNPVREVKIPSDADALRIHVLTPAEEALYFAACRKLAAELAAKHKPYPGSAHQYNPYVDLHDLARLMLLQGPRPEELLSLAQSSVNLLAAEPAMRIEQGKSRAARRVLKLRAESLEILARRIAAGTGARWIFASPRKAGAPLAKLNNRHNDVLERAGLNFVLYDFRHTFATRAADSGMPIATLAAILGHGNLRSVLKYVHPNQASINRELGRLDESPATRKPVASEKGDAAECPKQAATN